MADYASLIPVNVITGFLGSGKTTLLQRLLASPHLADTAVLINEFGEVALDHQLLLRVDESTGVLPSGCICCAIRGDLVQSIRGLFSRRERGEIPRFQRLVIETSGLADPAPIAYTLLTEPVIQHHFRLGNVVTTVDAVNGRAQLDSFPESLRQAAMADRIVITKTDLCERNQGEALRSALRRINPSAPIMDASGNALALATLLLEDLYDAEDRMAEARRWAGDGGAIPDAHALQGHPHTEGVLAFAVIHEGALNWSAFGIWLTMLLHRHGERVLRVKGLLNVIGSETPVAIHGVQHIVHPPVHLPTWPDGERRSRIVFIVKDLPKSRIEASLAVFNRLANGSRAGRYSTA
jgi:G3E family GTPase